MSNTTSTTNTTPATFAKLRTGAWGIRTTKAVAEGDRVQVTKKDGSTKIETVQKIIWTDGTAVWLCAIGTPAAKSNRRQFVPCGYPGCNASQCDECDGDGLSASGW